MSFYSVILFLHITGAIGIFIGMGLEWLLIHNLQKVNTNSEALMWTGMFKVLSPTFSVSGVLILASGFYMAAEIWGMNPWVISGFVLYIVLSILGGVMGGKRIKAIAAELKHDQEKLSDNMITKIKSPFIYKSLKFRSMIALSIIFMMTIKPDWPLTLESVAAALILGFILIKITK